MEQNSGAPTEQAEQVIGYGCICGFNHTDKKEFTNHVMFCAQRDGKGTHKSRGRVNMQSGEVVAPPYAQRSAEERRQTKYKIHSNGSDAEATEAGAKDRGEEVGGGGGRSGAGKIPGGGGGGGGSVKITQTSQIAEAHQLRMIPKVFTADYTPIMRVAQDAAVKYFGWRPDMPFENFVDTCLYLFFKEKGITLVGYVVDDSLLPKEGDNHDS